MAGETVLVIDDSPTILKVVQLVLTKEGYNVVTASDGDEGIEVAKETGPQIILLDFVMPRMNGYQVCRALHQEPTLKDVPVVLMSAKGDQVGERFIKVMGIVDYITKPFSPEAITGVVQHTLAKYGDAGVEELAAGGGLEAELEVAPEVAAEAARVSRLAQRATLEGFRKTLCKVAAKAAAMGSADRGEALDDEILSADMEQNLSLDTLDRLLGKLRSAAPDLAGNDAALAGDLGLVPLAEVLLLLGQQEQRGTLLVSRGLANVEVYFQGGVVHQAVAKGIPEEFLLGRFVLEQELADKEELEQLIKKSKISGQLLGATLLSEGLLRDGDLQLAIRKQTQELVYELLRWRTGRFAFYPASQVAPLAAAAALGLAVDSILMEGFRRVDEWHLIEREIDNFEIVFLRNEEAVGRMGRGRLTREELTILELVNGKNSVKEIVRSSRMGSFEVSQILYRLLSIKLVRKRVQPVVV